MVYNQFRRESLKENLAIFFKNFLYKTHSVIIVVLLKLTAVFLNIAFSLVKNKQWSAFFSPTSSDLYV